MSRYIVAITRWGAPLEQELAPLAKVLGLVPYDIKLRMAGPLPVVFSRAPDADEAKHLLATLRARGHGAVACAADAVMGEHNLVRVKRFELAPDAFCGVAAGGQRRMIPYEQILALLPARVSDVQQVTVTEKERKFSPGGMAMAMAVGPLAKPFKTVEKSQTKTVGDVHPALYVIHRNGREHALLCEQLMRYGGLGDRVGRTSQESFATLGEMLRQRAPRAIYDERLLERRKNSAEDLHLAAHLTAVGHLSKQM